MISLVALMLACVTSAMWTVNTPTNRAQPHSDQGRENRGSFVFEKLGPLIRSKSGVPARFPGFLPDVDRHHPVYAVSKRIDKNGYYVLLALELPCDGQNNCLYGSVQGSTLPLDLHSDSSISVKLKSGINGEFLRSVCRAYCTEAYIKWREGPYHYAIGIKAARMNELVKAANSSLGNPDVSGFHKR